MLSGSFHLKDELDIIPIYLYLILNKKTDFQITQQASLFESLEFFLREKFADNIYVYLTMTKVLSETP